MPCRTLLLLLGRCVSQADREATPENARPPACLVSYGGRHTAHPSAAARSAGGTTRLSCPRDRPAPCSAAWWVVALHAHLGTPVMPCMTSALHLHCSHMGGQLLQSDAPDSSLLCCFNVRGQPPCSDGHSLACLWHVHCIHIWGQLSCIDVLYMIWALTNACGRIGQRLAFQSSQSGGMSGSLQRLQHWLPATRATRWAT